MLFFQTLMSVVHPRTIAQRPIVTLFVSTKTAVSAVSAEVVFIQMSTAKGRCIGTIGLKPLHNKLMNFKP